MPSLLEDAIVLLGWRRQDRLRVRSQVRGDVEKVRQWPPLILTGAPLCSPADGSFDVITTAE